VANLNSKAVLSGIYNAVGVLQFEPFSRVTDLGSLLLANPGLSYAAIGNSYNSGVIEALNIVA
jgi:hypothetical protein